MTVAPWGTETGGRAPDRLSLAHGLASRRSVCTRSPGLCGSMEGATTQPSYPFVQRARQPGAPGTGLRDTDEACGLRGQLTGALSAIGGSCTDGPRGDDVGLRVFGAKGHSEGVLMDIQTARECARR